MSLDQMSISAMYSISFIFFSIYFLIFMMVGEHIIAMGEVFLLVDERLICLTHCLIPFAVGGRKIHGQYLIPFWRSFKWLLAINL